MIMKRKFLNKPSLIKSASKKAEKTDSQLAYIANRYYEVFVKDLILPALIGIHSHEKKKEQRICINVVLMVDDRCGFAKDKIQNVVSYEKIVKGIKKILRKGHVGLIETLAEDISKMCLVDNRVYIARIRIEKLEVFKESKSAGIEIERRSKNSILNVNKTIAFGSVPSSEKS